MLVLAVVSSPSIAYESDQLTDRHLPLEDAAPYADALLGDFLASAVAETNRRTRCEGSDDDVRRVLAAEIHRATGGVALYTERGFPGSFGFDRYSVALERSEAPRRSFEDRHDVFGDLGLTQAFVLATAGTCSTFRLGDTLVGTDKLAHFLSVGFSWYRWSRYGEDPDRALRHGTRRERTWHGSWTSRVFSYADMRANADGYRFYDGLLRDGSALVRGPDGCVTQARPWSWTEWADPMWDEVLDPPAFRRNVQRGVDRRIASDSRRYCEAWATLDADQRRASTAPPSSVPWVVGTRAPPRGDAFGLERVCPAPPVVELAGR